MANKCKVRRGQPQPYKDIFEAGDLLIQSLADYEKLLRLRKRVVKLEARIRKANILVRAAIDRQAKKYGIEFDRLIGRPWPPPTHEELEQERAEQLYLEHERAK